MGQRVNSHSQFLLSRDAVQKTVKLLLPCLAHYRPAMPFENRKGNLLDLFSSVLPKFFFNITPSRNLKFNNLGIFGSLKLRNLMGKILRISLKLNFFSNTLVCYGLRKNVIIILLRPSQFE